MNEDMTMPELLSKVAELDRRVQYIEQLMNIRSGQQVASSSTPNVDPMWQSADGLSEVRELVRQHKKIEAIKRYRELKGGGLAEAKNAIDAM